MIGVHQTIFAPPDGNCMAACVASILELPIDGMPNPHGSDWVLRWEEWLTVGRGLTFVYCCPAYYFPGYWIGNVDSPRGDWDHALVYHGEEIAWDPYPDSDLTEYGDPKDTFLLVPLDPAKR